MNTTLTAFVEEKIQAPSGADFNPDWSKALKNLRNSHRQNLEYLCTYYPRTVMETMTLFMHLMKSMPSVKKMFAERDVIRVLDYGCGTGGEILGLYVALEWSLGDNVPDLEIDAVDGNADALALMKDCVRKMGEFTNSTVTVRDILHEAHPGALMPDGLRDPYDVILTSKCLSELGGEFDLPYVSFANATFGRLAPQGIAVFIDVTCPQPEDRGGWWINQEMNEELSLFTQRHSEYRTIFPIVCDGCPGCNQRRKSQRFLFDFRSYGMRLPATTKVAFRVLSREALWQKVRAEVPPARWPISTGRYEGVCDDAGADDNVYAELPEFCTNSPSC